MKNEIRKIIEEQVICYKEERSNFFFTEKDTNWIFDFRKVFLQWKFLNKFSCFFWNKYENNFPFQIGGLEFGAVPLIWWIILEWIKRGKDINWFIVRKDRKTTWLWNIIEWKINSEKIIIVDDLFNSWNSIWKIFDSIRDINNNIFTIFTFVNFWNNKWNEFLKRNNLNLDYEFTLSDFALDSFWNSIKLPKEYSNVPIIYPKYKKIISLDNPNKYIFTIKSSPIKDWKYIYLAWEWGDFLSICSDTWNIQWKFSVNTVKWHKNILSSPLLIDNKIIFWSYDWNLYCLDKNTWKQLWINTNADWIGSSPSYSKKENLIYIWLELWWLNNKWSLSAFDIDTWEEKWRILYDDYVHCSPWYSEQSGLVVCSWNDWKFICKNADDDAILFELNLKESNKWWFWFSENWKKVYFWSFDKSLYCVDLIKKEVVWKFETWNIIYTKPLIIWNDIFFWWLDKFFYHIDHKWILKKKIRTFWKIFWEAIILKKGIIAFASNDSYIYVYNFEIEKNLFVIEHREKISSKLIFDNELWILYVNNFMNELFKYNIWWYL